MAKITFTVTNDLNHDQRMHKICSTLQEAGHEVKLLGRNRKNSQKLLKQPFEQYRLSLPFESGKLFYLSYNLKVFWHLLWRDKAEVIGAVDLDSLAACGLAAWIRGKKLTFDAHEYYTEVPELLGRETVKKLWDFIGKVFVTKASVCYTVGPCLAGIFGEKYQKPFTVIRNAPLKQPYVPKSSSEIHQKWQKKRLWYQGALNKGRGLEELIESMEQLPDWELFIAGEGDLSFSLREMVEKKKLENQVKFLGMCSYNELKAHAAEASLGFNLLNAESLSYYYSLANKFLDYIQFRMPQISMDFPEYKKINEEYPCAILLSELKVDLIVKKLLTLQSNFEAYGVMFKACEEAAEKYCWEREAVKLTTLYGK